MQPLPNKPAPLKYKFLLETTAWEAKQVGMDGRGEDLAEGDEKEIERWMGKGEEKEERNRDQSTSEMSPVCLAVAVELQGTAVTQWEALWRARGNNVNIKAILKHECDKYLNQYLYLYFPCHLNKCVSPYDYF